MLISLLPGLFRNASIRGPCGNIGQLPDRIPSLGVAIQDSIGPPVASLDALRKSLRLVSIVSRTSVGVFFCPCAWIFTWIFILLLFLFFFRYILFLFFSREIIIIILLFIPLTEAVVRL